MTLMNGLIYQRRAIFWTDTLMCHPDLRPMCHATKILHDPRGKWIMNFSGVQPGSRPVHRAFETAQPADITHLLSAAQKALRDLAEQDGMAGRVLLAARCKQYGARMFLVSSDALPFAAAFTPYETVQFMSSGAGVEGAPCDPETPEQMRRFIAWQADLPNTAPMGGDLFEVELSDKGVKGRRFSEFFPDPLALTLEVAE